MMEVFSVLMIIFIGLAGGLAVGSGFVAFIVVLDIIPRLAQLSRAYTKIHWMEGAIIAGALFWTFAMFFDWKLYLFPMGVAFIGLFAGLFVGMLAGALTEVLNVLPILAKRLQIGDFMIWLLMSMVLGKVVGSLFDWIVYRTL